jgi:hypothetical protein
VSGSSSSDAGARPPTPMTHRALGLRTAFVPRPYTLISPAGSFRRSKKETSCRQSAGPPLSDACPRHRGPVSSEPYLRRLRGMMVILGDVAINFRAPGAHGLGALIPRRRNGRPHGFPIGLLLAQDPVRRLREMPRHRPDGLGMAFPAGNALVEPADMASRVAAALQIVGAASTNAHLRY